MSFICYTFFEKFQEYLNGVYLICKTLYVADGMEIQSHNTDTRTFLMVDIQNRLSIRNLYSQEQIMEFIKRNWTFRVYIEIYRKKLCSGV